jgi:hypothetical protein
MTKALVETVGSIMLMDVMTMSVVPENRPALVANNGFVQSHLALGNLVVLATDIPDDITDAAWEKWLDDNKGDVPLAVESFCSQFNQPPATSTKKK